jgi:hypothetical protein
MRGLLRHVQSTLGDEWTPSPSGSYLRKKAGQLPRSLAHSTPSVSVSTSGDTTTTTSSACDESTESATLPHPSAPGGASGVTALNRRESPLHRVLSTSKVPYPSPQRPEKAASMTPASEPSPFRARAFSVDHSGELNFSIGDAAGKRLSVTLPEELVKGGERRHVKHKSSLPPSITAEARVAERNFDAMFTSANSDAFLSAAR